MAGRAIWKGVIRFGSISVPVKLYSAVEDRKIHFRLLHQKDQTPVSQKMVHPNTGETIPHEEIRRGYETEDGEIVLLDDEELQSLEPEASRDIEITRFVDPDRINHQWYDRPYYMGPDSDAKSYFALARALEKEKKEGFARWSMRKKRYIGALLAENGYLKMITLRYADEIVDVSELPRPISRPFEKQEIQMAEQLVRALEAEFDPSAYRDEYRDRVLALVETKARGGTVTFEKIKEKKPEVVSLADMLKKSIQRAKEERKIARA
jgi:DNA end-binding protein Ku